jgi:hypothetical protein
MGREDVEKEGKGKKGNLLGNAISINRIYYSILIIS